MVVIETPEGHTVAGAPNSRSNSLSNRDLCREVGEDCYIDEHMGLFKFGSLRCLSSLEPKSVSRWDKATVGNETVIAKLK